MTPRWQGRFSGLTAQKGSLPNGLSLRVGRSNRLETTKLQVANAISAGGKAVTTGATVPLATAEVAHQLWLWTTYRADVHT